MLPVKLIVNLLLAVNGYVRKHELRWSKRAMIQNLEITHNILLSFKTLTIDKKEILKLLKWKRGHNKGGAITSSPRVVKLIKDLWIQCPITEKNISHLPKHTKSLWMSWDKKKPLIPISSMNIMAGCSFIACKQKDIKYLY